MADQDDWPAHGVDGGLRVLLVVGVGGFGGLRYRHRVAVLLEDLGDGFPAGAIGECTVHQNHVLDPGWRRRSNFNSPLQQQSRAHQHRNKRYNPVNLLHDYAPLQFQLQ